MQTLFWPQLNLNPGGIASNVTFILCYFPPLHKEIDLDKGKREISWRTEMDADL